MTERRGTKALELWCRRMTDGYPGVKIDNMTTSWRDGLAFCAMIHHFRPDLIDFGKLNKADVYYNNALAFATAEKYLGIPALLDADDMAAYEVPDRLSILTYLSQFYQVFAAQDAAQNRLKRTSTVSVDTTEITKPSGPPAKMAHVVGVPKREPCRLCKLPVFLAERLLVGEKVFHRTCMKCARCGSQLSPGSFYETEIDDQYCCETCPDEDLLDMLDDDKSSSVTNGAGGNNGMLRSNINGESLLPINGKLPRNSVKERLAFFERTQNPSSEHRPLSRTKSLQKNVSDEEKCQLSGSRRFSYKMNSSSNFLNTTLSKDHAVDDKSNLTNDNKSISDSKGFNFETSKSDVITEVNSNNKSSPCVAVTMHLVLGDMSNDTSLDPTSTKQKNTESPKRKQSPTKSVSNSPNDGSSVSDKSTPGDCQGKETVGVHRKLSACVQVNTSATDVECTPEQNTPNNTPNAEQPSSSINSEISTFPRATIEDKEITERLSNVNARLQEFESSDNFKERIILYPSVENYSDDKHLKEKSIDDKVPNNSIKIIEEENSKDKNESPKELETNIESQQEIPAHVKFAVDSPIEINKNEDIPPPHGINEAPTWIQSAKQFTTELSAPHPILKNQKYRTIKEYPKDLDPFKSDSDESHSDDEARQNQNNVKESTVAIPTVEKTSNRLNPFDSSDDEIELEKSSNCVKSSISSTPKIPPPRPPPPRSTPKRSNVDKRSAEGSVNNQSFHRRSSLTSQGRRTPVPTPRSNKSQSTQNLTPESNQSATSPFTSIGTILTSGNAPKSTLSPATSEMQGKYQQQQRNASDCYGSNNYLYDNTSPNSLLSRNSDTHSSNNSINSFVDGTIRFRKSKRAPLPPNAVKELFASNETIYSNSKASTPNSSKVSTPKSARKKRPAPAPPKSMLSQNTPSGSTEVNDSSNETKNALGYPQHSDFDSKLSDEEKVLLEGKTTLPLEKIVVNDSKRIIHLDKDLIEDAALMQNRHIDNSKSDDLKEYQQKQCSDAELEEDNVVYRRVLVPFNLYNSNENAKSMDDGRPSGSGEYDMETLKDNKEAKNRNQQFQPQKLSSAVQDSHSLYNKSIYGKWKRRKGPAPSLPVPPRKVLQMLPLQEIKYELELIEVQQQGLEKQGVILENMIRERCEGETSIALPEVCSSVDDTNLPVVSHENSKEVEYLILQLFELVNEKNELFRRQAELIYLRRQHRLEQEQADLEYEIRVLMARPERNKTDSDKAREEALIEHLISVVQQRNHVVESLEMDRVREAEEDQSIKQRLETHIANRTNLTQPDNRQSTANYKLSNKEKKKQKEMKKINKHRKIDVDKDADETEMVMEKTKIKKTKKLFLFR